jgi:hypothetical protein
MSGSEDKNNAAAGSGMIFTSAERIAELNDIDKVHFSFGIE